MFFDPLYIIMIAPALILSLFASWSVKRNFARFSNIPNRRGITGAQAARIMLDYAGLNNVAIEEHSGFLSDHYDPSTKTVRLSHNVYHSSSIAAIGVACHEAGHAIQDATGYTPLVLRTAIVPFASWGSYLSWIFIIIGTIFAYAGNYHNIFIQIGIIAFSLVVIFQLITLPVEFDASRRAKELILRYQIAYPDEAIGVSKVLNAAALTYVAAATSAIMELLYLLIRFGFLSFGGDE
jgi:Zn-dependent membrane protease YugP